jgi:hypothetical protein
VAVAEINFGLSQILRPPLPQPSMPPKPKGKKKTKSGLSEHHKKKNVIKVSLQDIAICWCRGFRVGCGKALGRTQRFEHKRAEKERETDG